MLETRNIGNLLPFLFNFLPISRRFSILFGRQQNALVIVQIDTKHYVIEDAFPCTNIAVHVVEVKDWFHLHILSLLYSTSYIVWNVIERKLISIKKIKDENNFFFMHLELHF